MKVVKICFNRFSQKNSSRMGRKYSADLERLITWFNVGGKFRDVWTCLSRLYIYRFGSFLVIALFNQFFMFLPVIHISM